MEIKVTQLELTRFSIQARSHVLVSDQPAEYGGTDMGMTPPELMLGALGSCATFYAVQYLKTHNLTSRGMEVSVTAEKLKQPARMGNFHIRVSAPFELTAEQNEGLMRAVHHCLIHNTLLAPPAIEIELALGVAAV